MYVRFDGDVHTLYPKVPDSWKNVSNFGSLPEEILRSFGFYPVVYEQPPMDPMTQERVGPVYTVGATEVTATWTNVEKGLAVVKAEQIAKLKENAREGILRDAPEYQQRNVALGILSQAEVDAVTASINGHRTVCNNAEDAVNAATTISDAIAAADVSF